MGLFSKKENTINEIKNPEAPLQNTQGAEKGETSVKQEPKKASNKKENEPMYEKYKNIDWSKVSREKVFKVMAEVMLENKRLSQEINRLNSEIEYSYTTDKSNKGPDAKSVLEAIAQKIAPEVINQVNGGKKYSLIEMQETIISEVLRNKKRLMDKILSQNEDIKAQKELLDELQQQVYEMIEKRNSEIKHTEEITPFTEEDFKNMTVENLPEEKTEREPSVILKAIPIEKARILFNAEDSLEVAKAIGVEGLSEFPEIAKYVKNAGISENRLETIVSNFEKEDIVEIVRINTFQRNSGLRLVRLKEDIGYKLFKESFKKNPVKSEMQIIRAENDNYEHGYCIKDTCEVLRKNYGFEEISMDRKTNTIQVSNNNTWVPDIIGINPVSKKKEYFEVEMGTHNEANFNFKLDKALLITSELKIITQNKLEADKILAKVKSWYNSKKNHPNIVVKVYTYVEFKRKDEGRLYPTIIQDSNIIDDVVKETEDKIEEANLNVPKYKKFDGRKTYPKEKVVAVKVNDDALEEKEEEKENKDTTNVIKLTDDTPKGDEV